VRIYPIGYSTPGARERIEELLWSPNVVLIDTRITPWSWDPQWRGEALEARYGGRYRYAGKYLGNEGKDLGIIRIADIDTGIRGLVWYFDRGYDCILLCQCRKFNNCHVSSIIDHLLGMFIIEVVHFGEQIEWTQRR
jgi:hypothetical protein